MQALLNILREFTTLASKAPVPAAADAKAAQQKKVEPAGAAAVAEQKDEIVKSVESSVPVSSSSSGKSDNEAVEQKKNQK